VHIALYVKYGEHFKSPVFYNMLSAPHTWHSENYLNLSLSMNEQLHVTLKRQRENRLPNSVIRCKLSVRIISAHTGYWFKIWHSHAAGYTSYCVLGYGVLSPTNRPTSLGFTVRMARGQAPSYCELLYCTSACFCTQMTMDHRSNTNWKEINPLKTKRICFI
jgi:hypothetical protein